jgi:hypothetical protein
MRRDLYLMERILYRGEEELGNAPAPQLKTVMQFLIDRRMDHEI